MKVRPTHTSAKVEEFSVTVSSPAPKFGIRASDLDLLVP